MRMMGPAVSIAASLIALAGCAHVAKAPQGAATAPLPSPAQKRPAAAPTARPSPSASPAAGASAVRPVRVSLAPSPKPVPRIAPDASPQILDVSVSETRVLPGDRVVGSVVTSSNVASVEARIGGYAVSLKKVGVGRFALHYTVGPLPWFVHGNFTMHLIARNTRGDQTVRALPLTVR